MKKDKHLVVEATKWVADLIGRATKLSYEELCKKYPYAVQYIMREGIMRADELTLQTWDFEASLDAFIVNIIGESRACPNCKGRVFSYDGFAVNFAVPFVHGSHIHPVSEKSKNSLSANSAVKFFIGNVNVRILLVSNRSHKLGTRQEFFLS